MSYESDIKKARKELSWENYWMRCFDYALNSNSIISIRQFFENEFFELFDLFHNSSKEHSKNQSALIKVLTNKMKIKFNLEEKIKLKTYFFFSLIEYYPAKEFDFYIQIVKLCMNFQDFKLSLSTLWFILELTKLNDLFDLNTINTTKNNIGDFRGKIVGIFIEEINIFFKKLRIKFKPKESWRVQIRDLDDWYNIIYEKKITDQMIIDTLKKYTELNLIFESEIKRQWKNRMLHPIFKIFTEQDRLSHLNNLIKFRKESEIKKYDAKQLVDAKNFFGQLLELEVYAIFSDFVKGIEPSLIDKNLDLYLEIEKKDILVECKSLQYKELEETSLSLKAVDIKLLIADRIKELAGDQITDFDTWNINNDKKLIIILDLTNTAQGCKELDVLIDILETPMKTRYQYGIKDLEIKKKFFRIISAIIILKFDKKTGQISEFCMKRIPDSKNKISCNILKIIKNIIK